MNVVELHNVTIDLPVYTVSARSLRQTVLSLSTGGRIIARGDQKVAVRALDGVSFTLKDGDRLGLVGHNGSGKTTLLRAVAGIYTPTTGTLAVTGRVSSVLDVGTGLDLEGSGRENALILSRYRGIKRDEAIRSLPWIEEFTELGSYFEMPVRTYSAGMLARLAFAVATSVEPDILVMDEWLAAGDENFVAKAQARMESLVTRSRAMVLATHNKDIVRRLCNKVLLMEKGRVVAFGDTEEILGDVTQAA